jgi:hypothetical protein
VAVLSKSNGRRKATGDELVDLGQAFAVLRRRYARQGRHVRHLAAQADELAISRGIALVGRRKGKNAALDAIRSELGYHAAWSHWSATYDELAALADEIGRRPARDVADLTVKFDMLAWLLLDDDAVVDSAAARRVRLFARELTLLATPPRSTRK